MVIIFTFFAMFMYQIFSVYTISVSVYDFTTQAVVSVATDNAYNAYVGVKESNTYANMVSDNAVVDTLKAAMELNENLEQYDSQGKLNFRINNLHTEFINAESGATDNDITLHFETKITLDIAVYPVAGYSFIHQEDILVKSTYVPLF